MATNIGPSYLYPSLFFSTWCLSGKYPPSDLPPPDPQPQWLFLGHWRHVVRSEQDFGPCLGDLHTTHQGRVQLQARQTIPTEGHVRLRKIMVDYSCCILTIITHVQSIYFRLCALLLYIHIGIFIIRADRKFNNVIFDTPKFFWH